MAKLVDKSPKSGLLGFSSSTGEAIPNSAAALVKIIDNVSDDKIVSFNIPTGIPLVYELDDKLKPIRHYFLGDPKEIEKAIKIVEQQGKVKR